jgi:multidrug efflux pump subunit AcrA (membrane-fusion protein)
LTGGNGQSAQELDRLARIEHLLEQLHQSLDVQFERIAQLQAQLDRAISDRPIQPKS